MKTLLDQAQYDKIISLFENGKLLNITPRRGQMQMVDEVCSALHDRKNMICEAPTGVGKTYAYLIPIAQVLSDAKMSGANKMCAVISTATKALQRQILNNDLPVISRIYPTLKSAVWMGGENYLCGGRLRNALKRAKGVAYDEVLELNKIYSELRDLENGWRDELPFEISDVTWALISAKSGCCKGGDDTFCKRAEAYKRASDSDIMVVNHNMLCTMGLYFKQLHPSGNDCIVVADEAHALEGVLRGILNSVFSMDGLIKMAKSFLEEEVVELEILKGRLANMAGDEEKIIIGINNNIREVANIIIKLGKVIKAEDKILADQYKERGHALNYHMEQMPEDEMLEIKRRGDDVQISLHAFDLKESWEKIWKKNNINLLCSATMGYAGLDGECVEIEKQFDYKAQLDGAYAVCKNAKALEDAELINWIRAAINKSGGGALVLFTSIESMNCVYDVLSLEMTIKKQGDADLFSGENDVVFGVDTMWTGIDVKGPRLRNVIITKLPFRRLDNYSKCYSEYLEKNGGSPFMDWYVPEMINKARQGIGRLLRSETDRGYLFILDPRFLTTGYGKQLYKKLGIRWQPIVSVEEI